jgi:hypothetical protein
MNETPCRLGGGGGGETVRRGKRNEGGDGWADDAEEALNSEGG